MHKTSLRMTAAAALAAILSGGCATIPGEFAYWEHVNDRAIFQNTNSTQTSADRMHTHKKVIDQDARALVEDIDYIMLRDRPSRLSRWHNR